MTTRKNSKAKAAEVQDPNPFDIKNDIEYAGNRSNVRLLEMLKAQCMKLEADNRKQSVNIPVNVCPNRAAASNLFLQLRRSLNDSSIKAEKNAHFTSRGIFSSDGKKTYLGSRIWRIK